MHVVSRAKLDQLFDAIAHGADPFTVIDAVIEPQPGEWTVAKEAQG
jgi:hypothetical protein